MYTVPVFRPSQKFFVGFAFCILSLLVAAYGPMASYSEAQAVKNTAMENLRQQATSEIKRMTKSLTDTLRRLKVDAHVGSDGLSASITSGISGAGGSIACAPSTSSSPSPSPSASPDIIAGASLTFSEGYLKGSILLPCEVINKVKQYIQDGVTGLQTLYEKVQSALTLENLQKVVQKVVDWFQKNVVIAVQGAIAKAVAGATDVLSKIQTAYNDIITRITQVGQCVFGNSWSFSASLDVTSSGFNANIGASPSPKSTSTPSSTPGVSSTSRSGAGRYARDVAPSVSPSPSQSSSTGTSTDSNCKEVKASISSQDITAAAQKLTSMVQPFIQTIISTISSIMALLTSIISEVSGVLTGSGDIGGLMTAFDAILSQLSLVTGMAGGVQNLLSGIGL